MALSSMVDNEKIFWRSALFIFALLTSQAVFATDHIPFGHDHLFHIYRVEGMAESMSGGQFPVRIVGKSFAGYGEPSGIFYPDLFFYIPALLRMAGVPLFVSYNSLCVLINFATIFLTYWSFNRLLNSTKTAAVCAMIYGGFLYRLIDLYVRSALGEAIAMAFMPLALISLWLMLNRSGKYWAAVVVGFTGVLQSHVLSSLMMLGVAIPIALLNFKRLMRREVLISTAKAAGVTALLNLWFYVPFISFYDQIDFNMKNALKSDDTLHFFSFELDFFSSMQFFVGWSIFLVLIVFVVQSIRSKTFKPTWLIMLALGLLTLIVSLKIFPWKAIESLPMIGKQLGVLQFPFRFIMLGSIAFAYCAGIALVSLVDNLKGSKWIALLICFAIAQCNLVFLNESEGKASEVNGLVCSWYVVRDDAVFKLCFVDHDAVGYIDYTYDDITYEDIYEGFAVEDFFNNLEKPTLLRADDMAPLDVISDYRKTGMTIEFTARTTEPTLIRLPMFYYPGYEATTDDGRSLTVGSIGKHRLTVEVPRGETHVKVEYVDQTSWRAALMLSTVGLMGFLMQTRREDLW